MPLAIELSPTVLVFVEGQDSYFRWQLFHSFKKGDNRETYTCFQSRYCRFFNRCQHRICQCTGNRTVRIASMEHKGHPDPALDHHDRLWHRHPDLYRPAVSGRIVTGSDADPSVHGLVTFLPRTVPVTASPMGAPSVGATTLSSCRAFCRFWPLSLAFYGFFTAAFPPRPKPPARGPPFA